MLIILALAGFLIFACLACPPLTPFVFLGLAAACAIAFVLAIVVQILKAIRFLFGEQAVLFVAWLLMVGFLICLGLPFADPSDKSLLMNCLRGASLTIFVVLFLAGAYGMIKDYREERRWRRPIQETRTARSAVTIARLPAPQETAVSD
jgi:hypothetical protein